MRSHKGNHIGGDEREIRISRRRFPSRRVCRRFCAAARVVVLLLLLLFLDDCQDGHDVQRVLVAEHQQPFVRRRIEGDVLDHLSVLVEPGQEFDGDLLRIGRIVVRVPKEQVVVLVDQTQDLTVRKRRRGEFWGGEKSRVAKISILSPIRVVLRRRREFRTEVGHQRL